MLRVTQVLSLFQNLWKIPTEVLNRKGQIGTELHDAMLDFLVINPGNLTMHEGTRYYEYMKSFSEWAKTKDYKVKLLEERMSCETLGITGKPDAILEMDGIPTLIDFKTSAQDDPVCWRLQGTAYIHLLRLNGHEVDDTFFFIKMDKRGAKASTFAYKYTEEGWEAFLHALECSKYFEKWKCSLPDLE